MTNLIKSVSYNQSEILKNIKYLHCDGVFDVDATFGNGGFYDKSDDWPLMRFDKDESLDNCQTADSTNLPIPDKFVRSILFDPPFLTYMKKGRTGSSIMGKRFSGYWRYDELRDHYIKSLSEFHRVLRSKGVVVFKCQDIIHNHKMHATHVNVIKWAEMIGFRLKDLFILPVKHRMPVGSSENKQQHARVYHSYFLVFEA